MKLEVAVATARQAWDATITAMAELKAPGIQRTGVDKILVIRFWGAVGGANIKNMAMALAPQTRRTMEY